MRKKVFVYGAFIAAALIGGCALEPVDGVTDLFGSDIAKIDGLKRDDNCFSDDTGIQDLKVLYVTDTGRYVVVCSKWHNVVDGEGTSYEYGDELLNNPDAVSPDLCSVGGDKALCDEIKYYCYDDGNGYAECTDLSEISDEMPDLLKYAFNSRACPDAKGYKFEDVYLTDSSFKMENVCVKSVCKGDAVNLESDSKHCGECGNECLDGSVCANGRCGATCAQGTIFCGGQCIDPNRDRTYCGAKDGCEGYETCEDGKVCSEGICGTSCAGSQVICDDMCTDTKTDNLNCGGCGNKCPEGNVCSGSKCAVSCQEGLYLCDNQCVDGMTNPNYCGVTSNCADDNKGTKCEEGQVCVSGECKFNSCPNDNETLCSTPDGNKCIDVKADDADNCGSCGYKCSANLVVNATATGCSEGACQYGCTGNTTNVGDGNSAAEIRCVDTSTDVKNCGGKDIECGNGEVCVDSECVKNSCSGDEALCSTPQGNTCININGNDANNCGACGNKCESYTPSNSQSNGCSQGVCRYTCKSGLTNIGSDTTASTIYCVDLKTDTNNCGKKGNRCATKQVCVDGKCVQNSCDAGQTLCSTTQGNTCININGNDANNCGACGNKCESYTPSNSQSNGCSQGVCRYTCKSGLTNIGSDTTASTIYCVDLKTDINNCGKKGNRCATKQVCVDGKCVQNSCDAGQTLCSTTQGNTCININGNDANNCGACGNKCESYTPSNSQSNGCSQGVCRYTCKSGLTNIGSDTTASTIYCVDLKTDINNCGGKGNKCQPGQICDAGVCKCLGGGTYCDSKCVDTSTDNANCGGCGKKCASGEVCSGGNCGVSCVEGQTECNGKCVDTKTDVNNCGSCGKRCLAPVNSVPVCSAGQCKYLCEDGYTKCDGECVNTRTDSMNCGTCGRACSSGACYNGACAGAILCPLGETYCNGKCVDTQTDRAHCGGCNQMCIVGYTCVFGRCLSGVQILSE